MTSVSEADLMVPADIGNPWPGLAAFTERAKDSFNGRDDEAEELLRRVINAPLTVLFGKSGLGKTSLLQAGLFPRLRRFHVLPVYVRLQIRADTPPFMAQIRAAFAEQISEQKVDAPPLAEHESLWEYLHRSELELWSANNYLLTPLFVIDQFEELFTLGVEIPEAIVQFRFALGNLAENRIPNDIAEQIETSSNGQKELDVRAMRYGVLVCLREDFLPHLEAWRYAIPSLGRNRMRLLPMNRNQAYAAVHDTAPRLTTEHLAWKIVDFISAASLRPGATAAKTAVAGTNDATGQDFDSSAVEAGRSIEPALLSLFCSGLYERRKKEIGEGKLVTPFDDALLEGVKGAVIADYYRDCIQGLPSNVPRFIEEELITDRGYRNNYAVEDALGRGLITREQLDHLINRRLLRRAEQHDVVRVELTHDVLTQAVREERDRRRVDEEKRRVQEQNRKQLRWTVAIAVVAVVVSVLGFIAVWQSLSAMRANKKVQATEHLARNVRYITEVVATPQRSLLLSVQAANLSKGIPGGMANAIGVLRQQFRVTGGRPLTGPMEPTRLATFSRDRHWLATASDDGTIRLWDLNNVNPTSRSVPLTGHTGPIDGLAFSPDGAWVVSGGADATVRFWRLGEKAGPNFTPHYGAIRALAFSPHGGWLAFGTANGNVCAWKMSARGPAEAACEIGKQELPVTEILFSPRERWLATAHVGSWPNDPAFRASVQLWDLLADFPQREPKRLLHEPSLIEDSLQAMAFNADETRLAVAYGYEAQVWDLTKANPPHYVVAHGRHTQWILAVDLSPDNRWLATAGIDTNVKLWDLTAAGKEPILLKGHTAPVRSVRFSDDGRWLATAGDDTTARLWDLSDPTIPSTVLRGQDFPIEKVIFSPGAKPRHLVTVGQDHYARLWDIPDPTVDPIVLRGHKGRITAAAVSRDGDWIASAGSEDRNLLLWSMKDTRKPARALSLEFAADAISFSRDGRWLAAQSLKESVIHLWSFPEVLQNTSTQAFALNNHGNPGLKVLGFSPDSRWLVSGVWDNRGTVNVWDVSVERPSLTPRYRCSQNVPVRGLAFSADGRYAVTGSHGLNAHVWNLRSPDPCKSPRTLGAHSDAVVQVAMSPDSRWVATASFDKTGKLWDLKSGIKPRMVAQVSFNDRVTEAAFSPDGRWVAFGSWDRTIKAIDLKNPDAKPLEFPGHEGRVLSVSFTPDSQWLVTAGEDRRIRLWDLNHWRTVPIILLGHEAATFQFGFSPDSRWVFTGSDDGTVRLWRLKLTDLVDLACRTAGRQLTREEARDFVEGDHVQGWADWLWSYVLGDLHVQMPCTANEETG